MKTKKRRKLPKSVLTFIILDIITITCFFIMYGPFSKIRNLLVTTAMETQTHQYLARMFFNDTMISKILSQNYVKSFSEDTDTSQIVVNTNDPGIYESIYDEQILKRDPDNDLYKVIELEGNNYRGHMVVVYDPSRVSLVESKYRKVGGQIIDKLAASHNAKVAINASGFDIFNMNLVPTGAFIINKTIITNRPDKSGIIGFNEDHILMLTYDTPEKAIEDGMVDGMSFGPFLIVNGKKADMVGNTGLAPRTAIAQRKDGIVLLVTIDGRRIGHSLGINMNDLADLFVNYKAYNAANLDGGGSSSMVVENEIINVPGGYGYSGSRYLPNAWIVK